MTQPCWLLGPDPDTARAAIRMALSYARSEDLDQRTEQFLNAFGLTGWAVVPHPILSAFNDPGVAA